MLSMIRTTGIVGWHVVRALGVSVRQLFCKHPTPIFQSAMPGEGGPVMLKVCRRCEKVFAEHNGRRKVGR